ncbi:MAG: phospho-N-acetylmuramoyl-pentapeptide-transferase, partial [Bacteroidetes bacterium]|nr:phospho-N-acetylmuramoyl-pentapeptide-transferase [Bacteroidota bacterium]
RDLGLEGQVQQQGTPTMGGLIILGSILVPTLLFADLQNIYIIILLITTIWLGMIGFADDYIKVFKKNKAGLAGKFKIIGQVGVGIIIGALLFFNNDVKIKHQTLIDGEKIWVESKALVTTLPFMKNHEFDYQWLVNWMPENMQAIGLAVAFIAIVIFIVTAISNGANMTDGLDGLATGSSAIIGLSLAIFAYVSGNTIFADYLNIMYIPHSGELVVYIAAFIGACVGFLWYNSFPAQVFMGDTGSLALGGIIAAFAIAIRKEFLLPLICGIFLIENLSVMIQVSWFKYTKKRFGEGRRIFKMAPLHHHYQKLGMHEAKIVSRFWIVGIMLAVITLVTLKIR